MWYTCRMIRLKISIRNIVNVLLVFVGTIFFLYSYMLNILPVIDLGYLSLKEIYVLNLILLLIIAVCVVVMVKNRTMVYRGKALGIRSTAYCVIVNALKIVFCVGLSYCFFYYSITFG